MDVCFRLRLATTFFQRLRGLHGARRDDVLLIAPCNDIHTLGMRRSLDVAFVDADGVVIGSFVEVLPGRRLRKAKAAAVLERRSSDMPWFAIGDQLDLLVATREETQP